MKAVHFSKTTKRLFMAVALSGVLTACGGDKPAETPKPAPEQATKPVQTTEAKTAPSEEVPKQTVENENKTRGYPTDNDHTKPLAAPQEGKPEPKPEADTAPKAEVKALSLEEGKKRYETTCKVCHDQGLLEAPKLTDKANWAKRLEKGVDKLHEHSAKGFNKMPAQATGDVSEAEVYAAVDYMITQVK